MSEETNSTETNVTPACLPSDSEPAPVTAVSATPNPAAVALASKQGKKKSYGYRIHKMNNRQLLGELHRKCDDERGYRINQIFAIALTTIFESHIARGKRNAENRSGRK
jgi:hypothetical protein